MSAEALPITPARFRSALSDLPVSSLYAKHAELQNSITHMESSNKQLEDYARDNDDRECYEALLENRQVIKRFLERIELIKMEVVEVRGLPWRPRGDDEGEVTNGVNGGLEQEGQNGTGAQVNGGGAAQQGQNGAPAQNGDEEEGVFL